MSDTKEQQINNKHEQEQSANIPESSQKEVPTFGDSQFWDGAVHKIREVTPAVIINNGSRINSGFKMSADIMSLSSSLREQVDAKQLKAVAEPKAKLELAAKLLKEKQDYASGLLREGRYGDFLSHKWAHMGAKYRFAASCLTLFGVGLGTIIPEKPMTVEERETYRKMPLSEYIPLRIRHAFDPQNHITATLGLVTIPNGFLKALQGFKQSSGKKASLELVQGVMTMAAGGALSFVPDQEDAWQYSTIFFLGRAPFAGTHAYVAYKSGYPDKGIAAGDWQQGAQFALNQISNVFAFFYSGIKKLPDGTIIQLQDKELEQKALKDPELADALEMQDKLPDHLRPGRLFLQDEGAAPHAPDLRVEKAELQTRRVQEEPQKTPAV